MKAIITNCDALALPLPSMRLIADSALGRQCEPYWLDTENPCGYTALICPCYRVGRLGKNIDSRFAWRYIDAMTLAALMLPARYADCPLQAPDIYLASTSALIPGDELEVNPDKTHIMEVAGRRIEFSSDWFVGLAISSLTRFMTIKTGDRFIDCGTTVTVPLIQRQSVEGRLDGSPVLKFKVL